MPLGRMPCRGGERSSPRCERETTSFAVAGHGLAARVAGSRSGAGSAREVGKTASRFGSQLPSARRCVDETRAGLRAARRSSPRQGRRAAGHDVGTAIVTARERAISPGGRAGSRCRGSEAQPQEPVAAMTAIPNGATADSHSPGAPFAARRTCLARVEARGEVGSLRFDKRRGRPVAREEESHS